MFRQVKSVQIESQLEYAMLLCVGRIQKKFIDLDIRLNNIELAT